MNKRKYLFNWIFLFFLISLTIIGVVTYVYIFNDLMGYKEYPVDYVIGDYVGFNLDEDAIHFGTLIQGVIATRKIEISTNEDANVRIYFKDLDYVGVEENAFFLTANEVKEIELVAAPPIDAKPRYYVGKMIVIYTKP